MIRVSEYIGMLRISNNQFSDNLVINSSDSTYAMLPFKVPFINYIISRKEM